MYKFEAEYAPGQTVYLVTDPEQYPRMVTSVKFSPNGAMFGVSVCEHESWHFSVELSQEPNTGTRLGFPNMN